MSGLIGSTKLDPRIQTTVGGAVAAPPDNSFVQGMRQGLTHAGGSLQALAGGVGEALGADEFAKARYAKAAEAEALAATQAPEINQWQQVRDAPDFMTGMRNAGSYVAGLAGGAAPFVVAGGAAAALTNGKALPAMLAGTAAVAPVEIGAALGRQQHDPAALANNSAGMRLGTAALEGTARAGAMMAVPMAMGGKLLGKVGAGAERSMPAAIGMNTLEGVGGNAVAGAGAEKISMFAEDSLNPNRDTSGDNQRMIDAAVAGGALGVPFAGMGIAGHALHGKKPAPRTDGVPIDGTPVAPIDGAPNTPLQTAPVPKPSLLDNAKSLFTRADDNGLADIAADRDAIDLNALRDAPPEKQGEMLRAADGERAAKAKGWADELMAGESLSPENRAALAERAKDLSSRANQTFVAGLKMATETGSKALNAATEFYSAMTAKDKGEAVDPKAPIKLSSISAGTQKAIGDVVTPHIAKKYPDLMKNEAGAKAVTGTIHRAMEQMRKTGELDHDTAEHLHGWFGDDTPSVFAELHDAVLGDGPAAKTETFDGDRLSNSLPDHKKLYPGSSEARNGITAVVDTLTQSPTERYYGALNKLTSEKGEHGKLTEKVKAAMSPEMAAEATPESLRAAVKVLQRVAAGEHTKDLTPERAAFESKRAEDTLRAHFGDKTTKLLSEFKKDADKRAEKLVAEQDEMRGTTSKEALDEGGFEDSPNAGLTEATDRMYFGGGNDKDAPTFIPSERAHRRDWGNEGSQAARLLRDVQSKNPDMNVAAIPATVYAREHGWSRAQLMDATNGKPDDHVMIRAEGVKRDGMSWNDVERLKNDSHKYPESPSRIETDSGITLDAVKVLHAFAAKEKLPYIDTDSLSGLHRQARQFKEAIAQISDQLGEAIDVPPETIVLRGKEGMTMTWKELQAKTRIKDEDPGQTANNTAREALVKRERMEAEPKKKAALVETITALDDAESSRVSKINDPDDLLVDGLPKETNPTAIKAEHAAALGALKMKAAAEAARRGPLRDASGKQVREMTMAEHKLAREYNKLADKVEYEQSRIGMGGEVHAKESGIKASDKGEHERVAGARVSGDAFNAAGERVAGTRVGELHSARKAGNGEGDFQSYMNMESASWGGKSDIGPGDQIHTAAKFHGEKLAGAFKGSESMEAGKETNMLHADNFDKKFPDAKGKMADFDRFGNPDGTLRPTTVGAISNKINRLENWNSKAMREAGTRARALFALVESGEMKLQDQAMMASLIKDGKSLSMIHTINELHAKYKGKLPPETARPAKEAYKPNPNFKDGKMVLDGELGSAPKVDGMDAIRAEYAAGKADRQAVRSFGTDRATKAKLTEVNDAIRDASGNGLRNTSDMAAAYTKLHASWYKAGKSESSILSEFARRLNVPEEVVKPLSALFKTDAAAPAKAVAAKKPSAFVEKILGEGDLAPTLKHIKATDDVAGLRRVVDALAEHGDNARAVETRNAANERLASMIEADPTLAYSMQRTDPNASVRANMEADIRTHIDKVLGKSVDVEFKKLLHAGEFEAGTAGARDVLRVSVHSLDPMSVAYHESLHAFAKKLGDGNLTDKAHPLFDVANSPHVRRQLERLLAGETEALKQIANSPEERAAYMYQFWERGVLDVKGGKNVLEKIGGFLKKALGMWTNDQRAESIMDYFSAGEFARDFAAGDRNAVARALDKNSTLELGLKRRAAEIKKFVGPLDTLAQRVFFTGDAQVRGFKNAALDTMLDMVYSPMQGAHADVGYIPAARAKRTSVLNEFANDLAGFDPTVTGDALAAMQRGEKGTTPAERQVVKRVRKLLDEMYGYMDESGVKMGELGYGTDYFPRVWDSNKILANEQGFRDMMQHYITKGDFTGSIEQVISKLTRNEGSELQMETPKPGMQHTRERILGFISGRDAQPFLDGNLHQTLNSYVTQATRRAEWTRRFGDDNKTLDNLFTMARLDGADDAQISTAYKYLQSLDGTLGDSIDPKLRRAFGNAIVYQNIRILPLMIFSSMVDSGGIMVRGGTVSEAFKTFKRGFSEIPKGFKKPGSGVKDDATHLAETLGTIDSAVLMHTLGSSYSQGMTSNTGRRVNDALFKYNLAEQYNRSMRVGATEAAVAFLGRHADGSNSIHSPRWLAELGYKAGEIKTDANGRPLLHAAEFEAAGMSADKAQAAADRITLAVNKWVDGAVLRPNAAHKPIWMSDPHFALISHLKQFVYSFQETILKRVVNEAKHGNVGPVYSLAAYVPFMLAADLAKGALVNGGGVPAGRSNWDASDYAWFEMQRAGLFGVGQFGIDAVTNYRRGGSGIGALSGPTLEQLGDAASVIGGPRQFETFALDSLPANQLLDAAENAVDSSPRP